MTVNNGEEVRDKLARLRQKFLERARGELRFLSEQASRMRQGELTGAELVEAYQTLHRLAGSAGTFGLPDLGAAAKSFEKALKPQAERLQRLDGVSIQKVPVEQVFVDGIDGLLELVREQQAPGLQSEGSGRARTAEVGLGIQIRILIVHESRAYAEELYRGLAKYGFRCSEVHPDDPDFESVLQEASVGASVFLASESLLDRVVKGRERLRIPVGVLPVICLAQQDSFDNRYRSAERKASAFFSEPVDVPQLAERVERLAVEGNHPIAGRVLIVEDDTVLAEHYQVVLASAGIDARLVSRPENLPSELSAFQPDIVLMDVQLEAYSGMTLARLIRFEPQWLSLPIIYLSSEDDPQSQLDALSWGADEFLTKPVSDGYLVRSVQLRCYRARQLSELMNRDSLTGLLKHSLIKQEVDKELARCRRQGHSASIAMIDLDHFKSVNDTWGHRCGDRVIKALADFLRNRLRQTDAIGRYGGEEFLLVMPACEAGKAREIIKGIAESFAELTFFAEGDEPFRVTLSAGVACLDDFATGDQALEAADQALYQQKRAGRNGVCVYSSS